LVTDAGLGRRADERVRFLVDKLLEAAAPSNVPLVDPGSAKAVIDTAGLSLVRGASNLVRDLAVPPRIPSRVDSSAFEVGRNVAATPGTVVLRHRPRSRSQPRGTPRPIGTTGVRHVLAQPGAGWWPDLVAWLAAHGGETRTAPGDLGGGGLDPLVEAPGTYVFDR
jgi:poly(3-hydroxyalkanoate) synthetase